MHLIMAEIDHTAPLVLRERFAFSERDAESAMRAACQLHGVNGCAVLSTCNRTALWLSACDGCEADPATLLCTLRGVESAAGNAYISRAGDEEAARRLFETACGLRSKLRFEDQIITQVRQALVASRRAGGADEYIERLFQCAVACAKKIKSTTPTEVRDASAQILVSARSVFIQLKDLRCLVIGSGQMGQLAAQTLATHGARVTVTTRQYHYGRSIVPQGCRAVPYDRRYDALAAADLVLGATRSPHHTLCASQAGGILADGRLRLLIDLAVPRDFEPELGCIGCTKLVNIDELYGALPDMDRNAAAAAAGQAARIIDAALADFSRWVAERKSLPALQAAADAVAQKLARRMAGEQDTGLSGGHEAAKQVLLSLFCELQKTCGNALADGLNAYTEKNGGRAVRP